MAAKSKAKGTLIAANVCWDATVETTGKAGLTTSDPDQTPMIMSTGSTLTYGAVATAGAATAVNTVANNPWGTDGIAICYKGINAAFISFTPVNATAVGASSWNVSSASFNPPVSYTQLTP